MPFSTEDVAKAGRTTLRGVRLWDMHNLFGPVERDGNGARIFTEAHLKRAAIISAASMAGMSLREIKHSQEGVLRLKIFEAMCFMNDVQKTMQVSIDL